MHLNQSLMPLWSRFLKVCLIMYRHRFMFLFWPDWLHFFPSETCAWYQLSDSILHHLLSLLNVLAWVNQFPKEPCFCTNVSSLGCHNLEIIPASSPLSAHLLWERKCSPMKPAPLFKTEKVVKNLFTKKETGPQWRHQSFLPEVQSNI